MKLPSFQFYPGDWLKDPQLSSCSAVTRGVWIDALCAMHELRGGTLEGSADQLIRILRCTATELRAAIDELQATGAGTVTKRNGKITLVNRRMERDWKEREQNRIRQERFRNKNGSNGNNSESSHASSSSTSPSKLNTTPHSPPSGGRPKRGRRWKPDPGVTTGMSDDQYAAYCREHGHEPEEFT